MISKNTWYGAVLAAAMMVAVAPGRAAAKHGGDDRPGDVKGEGAGHPAMLAKHGKDDAPGDVKGEGAGHPAMLAKHGKDDAPGDVKGEGAGHPLV
jgi:hypothetical protein